MGVHRFAIVTAGRSVSGEDFEKALQSYDMLKRECSIGLCASHGLLTQEQFIQLKNSGVSRYHANIETSKRYFPYICSTHTFDDKLECIRRAKKAGLEVCSGGIIGMGETWDDRLDMALTLLEMGVVSVPNILVLGKALTGGYIGHAVTVANKKVWYGFYSDDPTHALMHGPTFMGNALACCAAVKSIELFERENYIEKIKNIETITKREMKGLTDTRIKEIRIMGGCVCIEVNDRRSLDGFREYAYKHGVFSRPFLNYMYAMVPYVISDEELVKVLDTMRSWFTEK